MIAADIARASGNQADKTGAGHLPDLLKITAAGEDATDQGPQLYPEPVGCLHFR
jgi:hypothetical protein